LLLHSLSNQISLTNKNNFFFCYFHSHFRSIRHSSIPVMQHDLINSTNGESQSFFKESKSQQLTSGIKYSSHNNCYTNCIVRTNCQMPHIPRPDGEFGRDTLSNHQVNIDSPWVFRHNKYSLAECTICRSNEYFQFTLFVLNNWLTDRLTCDLV